MNPNSANQRWSKWTIRVVPGRTIQRDFVTVKANASRFARKAFGSASEMRIRRDRTAWTFEIRTEGHPVHDAAFVSYMREAFTRFFTEGFGLGTIVTLSARLEAGHRDDGRPADQLVILPALDVAGIAGAH